MELKVKVGSKICLDANSQVDVTWCVAFFFDLFD